MDKGFCLIMVLFESVALLTHESFSVYIFLMLVDIFSPLSDHLEGS